MDCKKAQELMSEALDEQLVIEQRTEFFRHIEGCNACKKQWEQLQQTVALLQKQPIEECPRELTQSIKNQIAKEQKKEKKGKWKRISGLAGICAAVAVVATGAAFLATQGWSRETATVAQTENIALGAQEETGEMAQASEEAMAVGAGTPPANSSEIVDQDGSAAEDSAAIETAMPEGILESESLQGIEYRYVEGDALYIEVTSENQSLVHALLQEWNLDFTVRAGQTIKLTEAG